MNKLIEDLFNKLHNNPELSGQEIKSTKILKDFIKDNTDFEIVDLDQGFYAIYHKDDNAKNIAIRADYDAVKDNSGCALHLCGHDGHATSLCDLALKVKERGCKNNVYFLFQGGEETGVGAKGCLDIFKENIDEIYGAHNLPGFEFKKIFVKDNTFACTSCGLKLKYYGKGSHAAYPEYGICPANIVSTILKMASNLHSLDPVNMVTVNGTFMGNKGAGLSADNAEVYLTLRAESDEVLEKTIKMFVDYSKTNCENLKFEYEIFDLFPATVNNNDCVNKIRKVVDTCDLKTPMRWSEDFGYYTRGCKGAFFGVGSGVDYAGLHTPEYIYPVELIDVTSETFYKILNGEE